MTTNILRLYGNRFCKCRLTVMVYHGFGYQGSTVVMLGPSIVNNSNEIAQNIQTKTFWKTMAQLEEYQITFKPLNYKFKPCSIYIATSQNK